MSEETKIDWGGSAFPIEGGVDSGLYPDPGMSLRDWFAGQALAGFMGPLSFASEESLKTIAKQNGLNGYVTNSQIAASVAYGYADAMIAARKGGAE